MTLELTQERGDLAAVADAAAGAGRRRPIVALALARDLARLSGVLAAPITAVRRTALVEHVGFLVDQARSDGDAPGRFPVALSRLGHESRLWARDPLRRPQVRAAAEAAELAVAAAWAGLPADGPADGPPAGSPATSPPPDGSTGVSLGALPGRRPTALAYRYFWLLDDLPPHLAPEVTTEFTGPARWALRNVLSGGYNRRAYLMWFGGGSGPAV